MATDPEDGTFDIRPLVGVGALVLGSRRESVIATLGMPSHRMQSYGDEIWSYFNDRLELTFSGGRQFRLIELTVRSPGARLQGLPVIGISVGQLSVQLRSLLLVDYSADLGGEAVQDVVVDALGLSFWVSDGVVESTTVAPAWAGDHPVWPTESRRG